MPTSKNKAIFKQVLGTGGLEAAGQISSFLGIIIYAKLVPQDILGSYFLVVAILGIISFIGSSGVSINITRKINQSTNPEKELMAATLFTSLVASVFSTCVLIGQPVISNIVGNGLGMSLAVLLPVSMFSLLTGSVLRGEKKNTRAMALRTTQKVSVYCIGSIAILSGFQPDRALVFALLSGKLLEFGAGIVIMDIYPSGIPSLAVFKGLVYQSINLTTAGLGNLGQEWIDTLLIGAILTPELVAIYEIAWRLSAVGLTATNAVASVFYPRFAEAVDKGDHEQIANYTRTALFYVSIPLIALFAGALAIGIDLVTLVYGPEFSIAYTPLLILLAGRFPYSLSRILMQLGYSYNADAGIVRASLSAAAINAVGNVLLIFSIGIVGAAISSFFSFVMLTLLLFNLLDDRVEYPAISQFIPVLASSALMAASIGIISKMIDLTIVSLLLLIGIGGILFGTMVIVLSPTVRSDFRDVVDFMLD